MTLLLCVIIGLILGFFGALHLSIQEFEEMTEEELIDMHKVLKEIQDEVDDKAHAEKSICESLLELQRYRKHEEVAKTYRGDGQ